MKTPLYVEQDGDGKWYIVFSDMSTGSVGYNTKEDAEAIMGNLTLGGATFATCTCPSVACEIHGLPPGSACGSW